jgi:signal transduction histidine kinase
MAVLGSAAALCLVTAIALYHLRRNAVDSESRELGLLSLALSDEIDRGLHEVEDGLHAMRAELEDGRLKVTGAEAETGLRTRADLIAFISEIWLVDHAGHVLAGSHAIPAPALSEFSPALDQVPSGAIVFSRPFLNTRTQAPMIALAVHFVSPGGEPTGWILAGMPAQALLGAFSVVSLDEDARMAVFRSDGARLAGSLVGTPTLDEAAVDRRLSMLKGTQLRQFRDGSERLVSLHSLPRFGLEVVLTRDLTVVLDSWHQAARLTTAAVALLAAVMAVSVYLVQRADRRRAAAQQALLAQSARASKLESLGTLAGGVAHDFNNVLAAIVGFGEMAQDSAPPDHSQARHLEKLLHAAFRGKALVERILTFSRGGGRTSIVFELEPVVNEVLDLLAPSLHPGVTLERAFEDHGVRMRGDPAQAFAAIMNVCTNATQAMPKGGRVRIELERVHVDDLRILSHTKLAAGDYLALTVSDEGVGISPEVMDHLFVPFFTTRGSQAGTGLGLAVVHGVVAESRGAIDVHSSPGRGASFTLYFPECTDAPDAPASVSKIAPSGAGQTLLIVDDEPILVTLAEEMLTGLGYRPVGYTDPGAALQALRQDPQRYAAVITDEVMPGISGTQLTEALKAFAPKVPVLLVSGYGGAMLASRAATAGVARLLAKPLRRAELACALAEVLS